MTKKGKDSAPRKQRAATAQETCRVVQEGGYDHDDSGKVLIRDAVEMAKSSTLLYSACTMPTLPKARFDEPCEISVTNESTVSVIQRAAADNQHIGCLNFASAKNPGGGFLSGSQAQEEALSRASALVPCLETQMKGYYEQNRAFKSAMYLDLAIVSPLVPFFRDGEREGLMYSDYNTSTKRRSNTPTRT